MKLQQLIKRVLQQMERISLHKFYKYAGENIHLLKKDAVNFKLHVHRLSTYQNGSKVTSQTGA